MNKMKRIVHFDLKGAPPKVPYLEKVLIVVKSWGATGILLEWEDTFPYSSELVDVGSSGNGDGLYSMDDVKHILQFCKDIGLEAIQLVQCIGHMEFVLKYPKFAHLREYPRSPAVLCPTNPESELLVRAIVEQVLEVQPDASYIHIGADEVWHTAVCPQCQHKAATHEHKTASLYLDHIRDLVLFIKQKRPDLTVLMWDDMLRPVTLDTLRAYQLHILVEPVLWHYSEKECFQMDVNLINNYALFGSMWAASAFKGANGSSKILSPASRYASNHEAWITAFNEFPEINFSGIILTGWSRYDHYGTLCELLPLSLPSLASCLRLLTKDEQTPDESVINDVLPPEQWPGVELVRDIHGVGLLRERCLNFINGDLVMTYLNPWQLENNYTQPVQVDAVLANLRILSSQLGSLQNELPTVFEPIFGPRTTEEWVETFVEPIMKKLKELCQIAEIRCQTEAGVKPERQIKHD